MKLGKVRIGERFVYDDRGGVFQRISWEKARCIYGSNFGTELVVNPDMSVYAILDRQRVPRPSKNEASDDCSAGVVNTAVLQSSCPKCHGSLIGKPAGCPTCDIMVPDALTSSQDASVVPVTQKEQPEQEYGGLKCQLPIEGGLKVVFTNDDDKVISEISNATAAQIAALTKSDFIKLNIDGKVEMLRVSDVGFDVTENVLYLSVDE